MESIVKKKATKEDFMSLSEEIPYQLINGEIIISPAPKTNHQDIILEIASQIRNFLKHHPTGKVMIAPMDVHLDDENIFQPDILFISKDNEQCKVEDWVYGAPDIIFEVLSEFNGYYDTKTKFLIYEKYGVKEYFIIDPYDKEVISYKNTNNKFREIYKEARIIRSEILGMEIQF